MLEQLRMQEVTQIIFSVPEGAVIPGKDYVIGEPVLIIDEPAVSDLSFIRKTVGVDDDQGHIGASGITKYVDFKINEGNVLFGLWSYIYGINDKEVETTELRGTERVEANDGYILLSQKPKNLHLYSVDEEDNSELIRPSEYTIYFDNEAHRYFIEYEPAREGDMFLLNYTYEIKPKSVSTIKQIHNNIFCTMDIYMSAVNTKNDDKHVVCVHCDKVQIDTDLILSINNSHKASFTPIYVKSVPDPEHCVATITVI